MGTCGAVIIFFTMWSLYGCGEVFGEDTQEDDSERGEQRVEHTQTPRFVQTGSSVAVPALIQRLSQIELDTVGRA
jgi:hypothetical protein